MLKNVFGVVQLDDGDDGCCADNREKHRKKRPEADGAVEGLVDPWQEKYQSKAQARREEGKSGCGKFEFNLRRTDEGSTLSPIVSGNFLNILKAATGTLTLETLHYRTGRKLYTN